MWHYKNALNANSGSKTEIKGQNTQDTENKKQKAEVNPAISVITLNVSELDNLIKMQLF